MVKDFLVVVMKIISGDVFPLTVNVYSAKEVWQEYSGSFIVLSGSDTITTDKL